MTGPVFRDLDQATLDREYDTRGHVPSVGLYRARWEDESAGIRRKPGSLVDIAFGLSPLERLDILPPLRRAAPVQIFFHGGYWCRSDKLFYSFVARGFPEAVTVVANYTLCPSVDMDELLTQCRNAVAWVHRHAADFGGDPCRIFVSGHSAGAHITAMLAATDWSTHGLPADVIKGATAMSGLFELEPIRLSFMNAEIRLTPELVARNSPIRLALPARLPMLVAVGSIESAEFRRQSVDYAACLAAAKSDVTFVEAHGHHHYSILDAFSDPRSALALAVRKQMGLA